MLDADFMRTAEEVPAVRLLFGARTAAERAMAAVRGQAAPAEPEAESMRLGELPIRGEWVLLGQDPPREIAFGSVGRFWAGDNCSGRRSLARTLPASTGPGWRRSRPTSPCAPYGAARTLLSYECRTKATDPSATRAFMRYWRPLAPFIGVVLRAQLRTVESTLEEASRNG